MSYIKCVAYKESDADFFVNLQRVGLVRSAAERTVNELYPLRAFGDAEPSAMGKAGESYEIVIRREQSEDLVDFSKIDNFTLHIKRAHSLVEYGSCRCKEIQTEHTAGEPMVEVITVSAASRKEKRI